MPAAYDVSITDAELRSEPDKHTEYLVRTTVPKETHEKWHRYTDFKVLRNSVQEALARSNSDMHAHFPSAGVRGYFGRFSSDFVEQRRKALEQYLRELATIDELNGNSDLWGFLGIDSSPSVRTGESADAQVKDEGEPGDAAPAVHSAASESADPNHGAAPAPTTVLTQKARSLEVQIAEADRRVAELQETTTEFDDKITEMVEFLRLLKEEVAAKRAGAPVDATRSILSHAAHVGNVSITAKRALGLRADADHAVAVQVGERVMSTMSVSGESPVWEESLHFEVYNPVTDMCSIEVRSMDAEGRAHVLGRCAIDLLPVCVLHEAEEKWLTLEGAPQASGEIAIAVSYEPLLDYPACVLASHKTAASTPEAESPGAHESPDASESAHAEAAAPADDASGESADQGVEVLSADSALAAAAALLDLDEPLHVWAFSKGDRTVGWSEEGGVWGHQYPVDGGRWVDFLVCQASKDDHMWLSHPAALLWTDYTVEAAVQLKSGRSWSLGVRYGADGSHYCVTLDHTDGKIVLSRCSGSSCTELASAPVEHLGPSTWRKVRVIASQSTLRVLLDGARMLEYEDTSADKIVSGSIALCGGDEAVFFVETVAVGPVPENIASVAPLPVEDKPAAGSRVTLAEAAKQGTRSRKGSRFFGKKVHDIEPANEQQVVLTLKRAPVEHGGEQKAADEAVYRREVAFAKSACIRDVKDVVAEQTGIDASWIRLSRKKANVKTFLNNHLSLDACNFANYEKLYVHVDVHGEHAAADEEAIPILSAHKKSAKDGEGPPKVRQRSSTLSKLFGGSHKKDEQMGNEMVSEQTADVVPAQESTEDDSTPVQPNEVSPAPAADDRTEVPIDNSPGPGQPSSGPTETEDAGDAPTLESEGRTESGEGGAPSKRQRNKRKKKNQKRRSK